MLRPLVSVLMLVGACAVAPPPRPSPPPRLGSADWTPPPLPLGRPEAAPSGLAAVQRQLQPLRSVPESPAAIPEEARPYLRAIRAELRTWLLDVVAREGRVPPRYVLRATLDHADLTVSRLGEDLPWGAVTRVDVLAPGEDLTAVVIGLRLSCTTDEAVYVFRGARPVIELAQDRWAALTDARSDVRVQQARAARAGGVLLVTSLSQQCASRWQTVRFEGITEGPSPDRPAARWDLRQTVDVQGECGGFDPASLGMEISRNGFEMHGCAPSPSGAPRETRARYRYTHEGIEPAGVGAR